MDVRKSPISDKNKIQFSIFSELELTLDAIVVPFERQFDKLSFETTIIKIVLFYNSPEQNEFSVLLDLVRLRTFKK
jgi:hypothetical protein